MDGFPRTMWRWGAALLLATLVTGCSGGSGGSGGGAGSSSGSTAATTTTTPDEPFPTPSTEDVHPTTVTTTPDNAPIISLARLPIGGNARVDENDPARQCVEISWIVTTDANPVIKPGYAVEVTGASFSDEGFQTVRSGCGTSRPNCLGDIMRVGKDTCDLAVRALPGADPDVTVNVGLKGILYCPQSVGKKACQRFADAVGKEPGVTIPLEPAPQITTTAGAATGGRTSGDTSTGSGG